jgi:hypothetical protein
MGTAKKIGKKLESNVKSVGKKLDKAIIQPVVKTVKTIVKDPRALAGVALTMAFPGAGAFLGAKLGLGSGLAAKTVGNVLLKTALNGGNVKAAVISSAIPLLGQSAGNLIGKTLDSSGITGSLNNVITKAATGGLTAAALGKDPVAAMTFGGISAALPLVTAQIPGFGDLPDMAKSALTKTLTAQLTGKDPSQALFQSVIDSGVKTANEYLKPELGFAVPEGLFQAPGQPPQGMRRPPSRMDQQFKPFKMEDRPPATGIAALLPPPPPKKEEEFVPASAEPQSLGNFEDFIGGFAGSSGSMGYLGAGGGGYPGDSYSDYGYAGGDEYSYRDSSAVRGGDVGFGYDRFDSQYGGSDNPVGGDRQGSFASDFYESGGDDYSNRPPAQPAAQPTAPPAAPSEPVPFGKAFAQARLGGAKTFEWQGKSYTTELAPATKPAAPGAIPVTPGGRPVTPSASPAVPSPVRSAQPPAAPDSVGGGRGVQGGPTAEELAAYASSQGDTGPFVGYGNAFKVNPQTYKDINDVNDPKTLAFVSGLMGTAPDRLGYSVLNPNAEGIRQAGTAGFAAGTAAQIAPAAAGLRAALPSMRGPSALENYLAGSVTQKPLYHGTASDISQFSGAANKSSTPGIAGWLAQNPEYAAQYAAGMRTGTREGANVMPVYASIKKPMDLDDPEVLKMIKAELPYVRIPPPGLRYTLTAPRYGGAVTELAKQKGYDAFKTIDEGQVTFAPISPTQMKSAIGNRGTYDPFDARLNYAKGGAAKKSKSRNQLGIMALAVKRGLV